MGNKYNYLGTSSYKTNKLYIMKTTKLLLALTLILSLFNACSSDELLSEETSIEAETEEIHNEASKAIAVIDIEDSLGNGTQSSTYSVLIQYPEEYNATQIENSRNYHAPNVGLISSFNCDTSNIHKEIWTVDIALWNSYCCLSVSISYGQPTVAIAEDDDEVSLDSYFNQICEEGIPNTTSGF